MMSEADKQYVLRRPSSSQGTSSISSSSPSASPSSSFTTPSSSSGISPHQRLAASTSSTSTNIARVLAGASPILPLSQPQQQPSTPSSRKRKLDFASLGLPTGFVEEALATSSPSSTSASGSMTAATRASASPLSSGSPAVLVRSGTSWGTMPVPFTSKRRKVSAQVQAAKALEVHEVDGDDDVFLMARSAPTRAASGGNRSSTGTSTSQSHQWHDSQDFEDFDELLEEVTLAIDQSTPHKHLGRQASHEREEEEDLSWLESFTTEVEASQSRIEEDSQATALDSQEEAAFVVEEAEREQEVISDEEQDNEMEDFGDGGGFVVEDDDEDDDVVAAEPSSAAINVDLEAEEPTAASSSNVRASPARSSASSEEWEEVPRLQGVAAAITVVDDSDESSAEEQVQPEVVAASGAVVQANDNNDADGWEEVAALSPIDVDGHHTGSKDNDKHDNDDDDAEADVTITLRDSESESDSQALSQADNTIEVVTLDEDDDNDAVALEFATPRARPASTDLNKTPSSAGSSGAMSSPSPSMRQRALEELNQELQAEADELLQHAQRQQRQSQMLPDDVTDDCKTLLQLFGVPYIVSPGEAEAQVPWWSVVASPRVRNRLTDSLTDSLRFAVCRTRCETTRGWHRD